MSDFSAIFFNELLLFTDNSGTIGDIEDDIDEVDESIIPVVLVEDASEEETFGWEQVLAKIRL